MVGGYSSIFILSSFRLYDTYGGYNVAIYERCYRKLDEINLRHFPSFFSTAFALRLFWR